MAQAQAMSCSMITGARPTARFTTPRAQRTRLLAPVRAGNPFVGETNDPEKVKQRKDEKAKEAIFWTEPKNKNPLEKTTLSREGFGTESKPMKSEGEVNNIVGDMQEKASETAENIKDTVSDAVKKVTGQ